MNCDSNDFAYIKIIKLKIMYIIFFFDINIYLFQIFSLFYFEYISLISLFLICFFFLHCVYFSKISTMIALDIESVFECRKPNKKRESIQRFTFRRINKRLSSWCIRTTCFEFYRKLNLYTYLTILMAKAVSIGVV